MSTLSALLLAGASLIALPERGSINALDVLAAPEGPARDALIDEWARSVWAAYDFSRERVSDLLRRRGIV